MRYLVTTALLLASVIHSHAITRYATIHNRFGSLCAPACAHIADERLVLDNSTALPTLIPDTTMLSADHFRVQVRMANKHNNPRSGYTVHDANGAKCRINAPQWGIYFAPRCASNTRWALVAQCTNSNLNDELTDQRSMTITLLQSSDAQPDSTLASCQLTRDVNLYNGLNTFQLEQRDGTLTAWAGNNELHELFAVPLHTATRAIEAGCYVGAGAKVEVERCVVSCSAKTVLAPRHEWTVAELDAHFAASIDPVEGYWHYQDRDVDDRRMRLGGRYTVAVVREGESYEIIYLDGAETHRSQWQPGRLKGQFTPTIFSDHYDLMWVDATGEPITQDAYATVENGVLLTLKFPVYNSQLRLSKILHP